MNLSKSGSKSNNTKQRRFSARSKFKAIQALRFISILNEDHKWTDDCNSLWRYLYCISEMQELRLPCSEETLAEAIGYNAQVSSDTISSTGDMAMPVEPDPRLLVRTFLRDEGQQSAVSELCRSVI
jgi:hypothetical protein